MGYISGNETLCWPLFPRFLAGIDNRTHLTGDIDLWRQWSLACDWPRGSIEPALRYICGGKGGHRPVILHRFKNTYDVALLAHTSTNSVRREASWRASPGAPAVVSGRVPDSVSKFRKLDEKATLTEKIYASSKNQNYLHTIVLSLWNRWPSTKAETSRVYMKTTTINGHYPHSFNNVHKIC